MHKFAVHKFGGSSLATPERVGLTADLITRSLAEGKRLAIVVSAQGRTTDSLLRQGREFCPEMPPREQDALVCCGENMSAAITAAAISARGFPAVSVNAFQMRLITDNRHNDARITALENKDYLLRMMESGVTPVITGFQGIDRSGNLTTLGRGGSDTTAVALAYALEAEECVLFSDVRGVYTADPAIVPDAVLLSEISYDEMQELAWAGAKVVNHRSLDLAKEYRVRVLACSSFDPGPGTLISDGGSVEKTGVKGITYSRQEALITLQGISQNSGVALSVLSALSNAQINIEMLSHGMSFDGFENFSLLVKKDRLPNACSTIQPLLCDRSKLLCDADIGCVTLVGSGLRDVQGAVHLVFSLLSSQKIPIYLMSTSEIRITAVVSSADVEKAVLILHQGFALSGHSS
ncbi:MAG: aspartate kinase [Candidatus Wallbacteria bacterium]|nr:aspartate kinase [Candidatus Wallbacteria bacterium]